MVKIEPHKAGEMITAIIQARTNSTRYPGKALQEICGKPMIGHVIERVMSTEIMAQMGQVVLAIPKNEPILYRIGEKLGAKVYVHEGDENDVLGRYYGAVKAFDADPIIRVTGDSPLIDPGVIAGMVQYFFMGEFDYLANRPSYPDGYDCEVFTRTALETAQAEVLPTCVYDREHVTSYFGRHPDRFKLGQYRYDVELPPMKVSVDTPEELELVRRIMGDLGECCGLGAVLEWWNMYKGGRG